MRVILKDNVPNLGQKDDIKDAKPGFWRNFLLPKGLAVEATSKLEEHASKRREERIKLEKAQEEKLAKAFEKIKEKILVIKAKADEKGSLFAGIGVENIVEAIKDQFKIDVLSETVELKEPIKKIGQHEIKIKDIVLKIEVKPFEE